MIRVDAAALSLIDAALAEDVGGGDVTTLWTVPEGMRIAGRVVAKADGVIAGASLAEAVFRRLDPSLDIGIARDDGQVVAPGDVVLAVTGEARAILTGERTALNFLQRLSGIATSTRRYVEAVRGTGARILDTRKTAPGWRALEKAAVRAGGGYNHRAGLFDMVLIKDNHIAAAGGVARAIARVRERNTSRLAVEVEVTTMQELEEALDAGVDRILLDNLSVGEMRAAVERVRAWSAERGRPAPELEASGNITLERARAIAETGVDFISVGAITHSAPALDLSLRIEAA
ncbi:MAG TPA: carboxylating nicotinate-nucleotide diphosphorylase [Longimicrobiales bacterium]